MTRYEPVEVVQELDTGDVFRARLRTNVGCDGRVSFEYVDARLSKDYVEFSFGTTSLDEVPGLEVEA